MKIPKYIDEALRLRTKYAELLDDKMDMVDEWLDKNGIECDSADTRGGVEIYVHPRASEKAVRAAIESKGA